MKVTPLPMVEKDDFRRHACTVVRTDAAHDSEPMTVWFDLPLSAPDGWHQTDAEPFLLVALMQAMHEGFDLLIEGEVSRTLLANLEEFMGAWVRMRPATYSRIEVRALTVTERTERAAADPNAAVLGFSGGVDSSFTVWRHHSGAAGHRSHRVSAAVMIQGMDMRLDQSREFDIAFGTAAHALASLGLSLQPMRTNLRQFLTCPWDDSHGCALASCLQFFKPVAGTALLASCEPFGHLQIPWGTSPLTDHLLSSDSLRVVHDGADFSRSEKVKALSQWPGGCEALRVCFFTDAAGGANCLRCEKCLRTIANFVVQDLPVPASLGGDARRLDRLIWRIKLRNPPVAQEWQLIQAAARPDHRWRRWIPWLLFVHRVRNFWIPQRERLRRLRGKPSSGGHSKSAA
jgi:hypothetical protein